MNFNIVWQIRPEEKKTFVFLLLELWIICQYSFTSPLFEHFRGHVMEKAVYLCSINQGNWCYFDDFINEMFIVVLRVVLSVFNCFQCTDLCSICCLLAIVFFFGRGGGGEGFDILMAFPPTLPRFLKGFWGGCSISILIFWTFLRCLKETVWLFLDRVLASTLGFFYLQGTLILSYLIKRWQMVLQKPCLAKFSLNFTGLAVSFF